LKKSARNRQIGSTQSISDLGNNLFTRWEIPGRQAMMSSRVSIPPIGEQWLDEHVFAQAPK